MKLGLAFNGGARRGAITFNLWHCLKQLLAEEQSAFLCWDSEDLKSHRIFFFYETWKLGYPSIARELRPI